jgi:hypothetical protein
MTGAERAPDPAADLSSLAAADFLALAQSDVSDARARDAATAAALRAAIADRARARRAGAGGWLADEIARRGGAPFDAPEVF